MEHHGATASRVLTSGSTSSRCLLPNRSIASHYGVLDYGNPGAVGAAAYLDEIPQQHIARSVEGKHASSIVQELVLHETCLPFNGFFG